MRQDRDVTPQTSDVAASRRSTTAAAGPAVASRRAREAIGVASLFVIVTLLTLLVLGGIGPLRAVMALVFAVFVPGWAVVSNLRGTGQGQVALAVALSLAILGLVATALLWAHFWHPVGLGEVECVVAAGLVVVSLFRRDRSRRSEG